jgi:hypothetical protein
MGSNLPAPANNLPLPPPPPQSNPSLANKQTNKQNSTLSLSLLRLLLPPHPRATAEHSHTPHGHRHFTSAHMMPCHNQTPNLSHDGAKSTNPCSPCHQPKWHQRSSSSPPPLLLHIHSGDCDHSSGRHNTIPRSRAPNAGGLARDMQRGSEAERRGDAHWPGWMDG